IYGQFTATTDTIKKYGCALTSCAMLINYQAASQGSAFTTTPATLNTWLQNNGGYSSSSGVIWDMVAKYARANGVNLYFKGGVGFQANCEEDDFTVDSYLCANEPVLLKVTHPQNGN